jgi:transposase
MSDARGKTYRPWDPQHYRHEAHSPEAKLPQDDLVFFVLDTVPRLDLSRFYAAYEDETRGAPPFDPQMMVCLLLYAYCVGVFSSRKIAQACERNLAFIAIVGAERSDCGPSVIFASCIWTPFALYSLRSFVSRARRGW